MSDETKVEVGDKAKCRVTNIEGVVIVRHDYLYGITRIGIQPEGSCEGKPHETHHVDLPQAELLTKHAVSRADMIPNKLFNLGDVLRDKISGFEGVCAGRAEWLYACTKAMVTPQKLEEKEYKLAKAEWFDEPQLELVTKDVIEPSNNHTGGFDKSICPVANSSRN